MAANNSTRNIERVETIVWEEDFENDIDWTSYDATLSDAEWHLYNGDYSYSGPSWWMGDPVIGGYLDHVYVVLDTDVITVPNNGHLTFMFNYNCEPPGTDSTTPEYNGWDGCNVRISTDGENWNVINGAPAYDASSLYSFGVEFSEGANIAGWCGESDGWIDADFDLSTYAGEDVQIRFAFASDPATNTTDNGDFFGMMIDNIALGDYTNYGSSSNITPGNLVEGGGDYWHLSSPGFESDTAVSCDDENSIGAGWYNYYESPLKFLPNSGEIYLDMMLNGTFDNDSFWGCDISVKTGNIWSNWYNVTNPTNDPDLLDFVFGAPGENWAAASDVYDVFPIDLTAVSGHYVKFRVYLKTSENPLGTGFRFDDFTISQTLYPGDAPQNLQEELNDDFTVTLNWDENSEDNLLGYNIYRIVDGEYHLIETVETNSYEDLSPIDEYTNSYAVTAVINDDETDYSAMVSVFVPAETATILINDDGSAESAYLAGTLNSLAVNFTTEDAFVTHLQVYLESVSDGAINYKIWDTDADGFPLIELANFYVAAEELVLGWNFVNIPEEQRPFINSGSFCVGIFELSGASSIGFDDSSLGNSFSDENGSWEVISGNLMIRAIIDVDAMNSDDEELEIIDFKLANYPNPFNPSRAGHSSSATGRCPITTIKFESKDSFDFAEIGIYNMKGQRVRKFSFNSNGTDGRQNRKVVWNGKDGSGKSVGTGIFFYKLSINGKAVASQKMLMMK